jgi:hypothetical protein
MVSLCSVVNDTEMFIQPPRPEERQEKSLAALNILGDLCVLGG